MTPVAAPPAPTRPASPCARALAQDAGALSGAGQLGLRAGELVEVRSEAEILRSLNADGRLDGLPFMPEMLQFCGQRFRVFRRADKTCDTIAETGSRRMRDAVHLEGARCDGGAHGGCQAGCLIFWKEAWLKRPDETLEAVAPPPNGHGRSAPAGGGGCTEEGLFRATSGGAGRGEDATFACQATELLRATSPLSWWDVRQYVREIRSGNVRLREAVAVLALATFNAIQRRRRGAPYPLVAGTLKDTPREVLNLRPGELVQVKSKAEIVSTLDARNRNRGLFFDVEMVQYCGRVFRVRRRVERIINERSGKMMRFPNDCIVLDGVVCSGRFSRDRLLCPRSIYPYWREIWLRRVESGRPPEPEPGRLDR